MVEYSSHENTPDNTYPSFSKETVEKLSLLHSKVKTDFEKNDLQDLIESLRLGTITNSQLAGILHIISASKQKRVFENANSRVPYDEMFQKLIEAYEAVHLQPFYTLARDATIHEARIKLIELISKTEELSEVEKEAYQNSLDQLLALMYTYYDQFHTLSKYTIENTSDDELQTKIESGACFLSKLLTLHYLDINAQQLPDREFDSIKSNVFMFLHRNISDRNGLYAYLKDFIERLNKINYPAAS